MTAVITHARGVRTRAFDSMAVRENDLVAGYAPRKGPRILVTPMAIGLVPGFSDGGSTLLNSTEFLGTETQGLGFILGCNMTVYDLEFVWYNGSVSVQQMTLSNTSVVVVLTAPFVTKLANMANLAQSAAGEGYSERICGEVDNWLLGHGPWPVRWHHVAPCNYHGADEHIDAGSPRHKSSVDHACVPESAVRHRWGRIGVDGSQNRTWRN
jgi:hypothetical protein